VKKRTFKRLDAMCANINNFASAYLFHHMGTKLRSGSRLPNEYLQVIPEGWVIVLGYVTMSDTRGTAEDSIRPYEDDGSLFGDMRIITHDGDIIKMVSHYPATEEERDDVALVESSLGIHKKDLRLVHGSWDESKRGTLGGDRHYAYRFVLARQAVAEAAVREKAHLVIDCSVDGHWGPHWADRWVYPFCDQDCSTGSDGKIKREARIRKARWSFDMTGQQLIVDGIFNGQVRYSTLNHEIQITDSRSDGQNSISVMLLVRWLRALSRRAWGAEECELLDSLVLMVDGGEFNSHIFCRGVYRLARTTVGIPFEEILGDAVIEHRIRLRECRVPYESDSSSLEEIRYMVARSCSAAHP
jgi:hypothetical protein